MTKKDGGIQTPEIHNIVDQIQANKLPIAKKRTKSYCLTAGSYLRLKQK
jgi:hypothetical protein